MNNVPTILKVPTADAMRKQFIDEVFLPFVTEEVGEEAAKLLARGLISPNESASLLLDSMILFLQQETRNENYKYLQNFSETATEPEMIDLIVSRLGVKRQVLIPENKAVFPPQPAVMESNESVLLRYSLAPYSLSCTGTRMGYKFHAMTLGARPIITVERESENVVALRYEFQSTDGVLRPKDAEARMLTPNSGEIEIRVLSPIGDGTADDALLKSVLDYCSRPDIGQESDEISTKSADILSHTIEIDVWEENAPTRLINREALAQALNDYAKQQHKQGGEILRSKIDQIAHNHNVKKLSIIRPAVDVVCDWYQAPYVTGVSVNVRKD